MFGAHTLGAQYGLPDWPSSEPSPSAYDSFTANIGKAISIGSYGGPWRQSSGTAVNGFPTTQADRIRAKGAIPLITWSPRQAQAADPGETDFTLDKLRDGTSLIITGKTFAQYIDEYATTAQAWGHPFFLRMMHEMNGDWYPWAEGVNSNGAGDYVATWQYIHDRFVAICPNATFVWCVNLLTMTGASAISTLYPGDTYVDWVAIDAYNKGGTWNTFNALLSQNERGNLTGSTYSKITATIAPSKPLMLAEVGTIDGTTGQKATWLTDMLGTQLPGSYSAFKAFLYYNDSAYPDGTNPVNIENSTPAGSAVSAFADGIAASRYAGNQFGSLAAGKVAPL
jgi:hypothetical protein